MRSLVIGEVAKADIVDVLRWSDERCGEAARVRYESLNTVALRDINLEPEHPGSHARSELGLNVRSWHLKMSRFRLPARIETVKSPRHIFFYQVSDDSVNIARLLHEAMDLPQQVASSI